MENQPPELLLRDKSNKVRPIGTRFDLSAYMPFQTKRNRNHTGAIRTLPVLFLLFAMVVGPLAGISVSASPAMAATDSDTAEEIVYIDANGVIRVIDHVVTETEVQWVSPKAGWKDLALGDVNADGDMEIVAIGTDANDVIQIAVYDPVVKSGGANDGQEINGIPWATLWETSLLGFPELVLAGDFDENIAGDEIAYVYRDANLDAITVVMNTDATDPNAFFNGVPTGRAWKEHVRYTDPVDGRRWKWGDNGFINGSGPEEIVLVDSKGETADQKTRFDVFDIAQGFLDIDGKSTDSDSIRKVAVGQIIEGGAEEIAEVRSAKAAGNSLFVYKWDDEDNDLNRDEEWAFAGPESVFLADISGNGDDEVFILRKQPSDNGIRMIMVDEWGDDQDRWGENPDYPIEESLEDLPNGTDDAYTLGEGGDVDGDGKDEIVLLSKDYIIVYPRPEDTVNESSTVRYDLQPYLSNNDTIAIGDLDGGGFATDPFFSVSQESISGALQSGTKQDITTFTVENVGTSSPVNYYFSSVPYWANLTQSTVSTPGSVRVQYDATGVSAGQYESTIYLNSNEFVTNAPLEIQLKMTVSPVDISLDVEPAQVGQTYFPCVAPVTTTVPYTLNVTGGEDLFFEAAILPVPTEGVAAAGTQLTGEITGGEVDDEGWVTLYDADGNTMRYPGSRVAPEVESSAIVTMTNYVNWIKNAGYGSNQVPTELWFTIDPTILGAEFSTSQAVLVLVADSRAGLPPDNVTVVRITNMCVAEGNRGWAPTLKVFSQ